MKHLGAAALAITLLACTVDPPAALRGPLPGTGDRPVEVTRVPGGRLVTHAAGRTFVADHPRRVASVEFADELLALGVTPIGEVGSWGNTFQPRLRPWLADATYLGGEDLPRSVRLEAVYAARPDLIIADVALADTAAALARIAPTVVLRKGNNHDLDRLRDLGRVLGREARAEAAVDWYTRKTAAARRVLAAALGDATIGLARVQHRRLKLYGNDWFIGPLLYRELGLHPPALIDRLVGARVNAWLPDELLPELDADHLLLMIPPIRTPEIILAELARDPAWRLVPAARAGHVHPVPTDPWFGGGVIARALVIDELLRRFAPAALASGALDGLLGPLPPAAP